LSKPKKSDFDTPAVNPSGFASLQVADALRWAVRLLTTAAIETPRLDAELLLAHVLQCNRAQLRAYWSDELPQPDIAAYTALVRRRAAREPAAYLLGERPFYDITLTVTPAVLVPRPETEHLIEAALAWAAQQGRTCLRGVDVGTGSGAIAIVLARHLPGAAIAAVDVSPEALAVAQHNAARLGVAARIAFAQSDLLAQVMGNFDLIVANLPYVDRDELPTLMPEVSRYEPQLALDGGPGGLDIVARLIAVLPTRLAPGGLALFELDPRQMAQAADLARAALPTAIIATIRDYGGHERVLAVERKAEEGKCR